MELGCVRSHLNLVAGQNTNNGEQGTSWLPALGAATGVVMGDVAAESHLNGVARTFAS